jgi:hypothetical protein
MDFFTGPINTLVLGYNPTNQAGPKCIGPDTYINQVLSGGRCIYYLALLSLSGIAFILGLFKTKLLNFKHGYRETYQHLNRKNI